MTMTITEALAELKLIQSKIEKKQGFILTFLCRQEGLKDPLEKDGGAEKVVASERQAVNDLLARYTKIRTAIADANAKATVEINGSTRSVAEWLVWRRDVVPVYKSFLTALSNHIQNIRRQIEQQRFNVQQPTAGDPRFFDLKVNTDEKALSDEIERLTDTLGVLDGRLSLHNATVTVEV